MNGGPCYECMEVYEVSFRNYLAATDPKEGDLLSDLGLSADELHRRSHGGGVTREAWASLGLAARRRGVMCSRRECVTCYREQFVIPMMVY